MGTITVRNPIHPLYGQILTIRNVRRTGTHIEFVVDHPDGGVLTLPAWATDYTPHLAPPRCRGTIVQFHPAQLVSLSVRVKELLESSHPSSDKTLDKVASEPAITPPGALETTVPGDQDDATRHTTTDTSSIEPTPTAHSSRRTARRTDASAEQKGDTQ